MADWPAKKNATFELQFPIYDADGDLVSAAAALDTEISQDGGTFADATNEAVEIATASGCYKVSLTAAEMNVDRVMTITKTSTGGAKTAVNLMYTVTRQLVDLAFPATSGRSLLVETDGMVHGDLKEWLGVAPNALVSSRVDASVGAMAANVLSATAIAVGAITSAKFAAGAIDAAAIATDAIGASELAADAVAEIADQLWDEAKAGHVGAGSFGEEVQAHSLSSEVATVQSDTDDIQTRLPAALVSGRMDSDVGAMQAGVVTAAAIATAAIDADAIAADAIGASELAADAANEIADAVLKRDIDQVEATAPKHSLTSAILKAVSKVEDDAGTLKTYRTDGATLQLSQTIAVNAAADPIDSLTVAV